jgi:RNA polymerase sigma-70 factor (ECF subfamily)
LDSEVSSEDLMLRYQGGDLDAFVTLMNRHKHEIYNFCARFIHDGHYANDLAQDVFVSLYRSASDYKPTAPFRAYLFRIARNACLNHIERQNKVVPFSSLTDEAGDPPRVADSIGNASVYSLSDMPETTALRKEYAENLRRALALLTEKQRTALFLFHFHGLSYKEIAQVIQCPVGTVRSRISAAYAALRKELAEDEAHVPLATREEDGR